MQAIRAFTEATQGAGAVDVVVFVVGGTHHHHRGRRAVLGRVSGVRSGMGKWGKDG